LPDFPRFDNELTTAKTGWGTPVEKSGSCLKTWGCTIGTWVLGPSNMHPQTPREKATQKGSPKRKTEEPAKGGGGFREVKRVRNGKNVNGIVGPQ